MCSTEGLWVHQEQENTDSKTMGAPNKDEEEIWRSRWEERNHLVPRNCLLAASVGAVMAELLLYRWFILRLHDEKRGTKRTSVGEASLEITQ